MAVIRKKPYFTYVVFGLYLLILVWLVLFKLSFSFSDILMTERDRSINLIPFYYDVEVGAFHAKEVIMNVLVFIPLGIYLRMLDTPVKLSILIAFLSSLTFEIVQFIFAIGSSDMTDLITNTVGAAIGLGVYTLARLIFRKKGIADLVINVTASFFITVFLLLAAVLFIAN